MQFVTPMGVGAKLPVALYVDGIISNAVNYSYSPPFIQRLVVDQPPGSSTTTTLRLVGINFGGTHA